MSGYQVVKTQSLQITQVFIPSLLYLSLTLMQVNLVEQRNWYGVCTLETKYFLGWLRLVFIFHVSRGSFVHVAMWRPWYSPLTPPPITTAHLLIYTFIRLRHKQDLLDKGTLIKNSGNSKNCFSIHVIFLFFWKRKNILYCIFSYSSQAVNTRLGFPNLHQAKPAGTQAGVARPEAASQFSVKRKEIIL